MNDNLIKGLTVKTGGNRTILNTSKPNLGLSGVNWTLTKAISSPFDLLPNIRLDQPIGGQVKIAALITAKALAGRAQNSIIQTLNNGVSNVIRYNILGKPKNEVEIIKSGEADTEDYAPYYNYFNHPVTDYLVLEGGEGDIKGMESEQFVDYHAVMKVSQKKNILLTVVQGRDKTRKEMISGGDYMVNVVGRVVSESKDKYPAVKVKKLIEILNKKEVIPCNSPFLEMFGITGLLVLDYDFPQTAGFHNVQEYSFSAVFENSIPAQVYEQQQREIVKEKAIQKANGWIVLDNILEKTGISKLIMK